jgi:hypothetical protein
MLEMSFLHFTVATSKASDLQSSLRVDHAAKKISLAPRIALTCLVPVVRFSACWFLVSRKQAGRLAAHLSFY